MTALGRLALLLTPPILLCGCQAMADASARNRAAHQDRLVDECKRSGFVPGTSAFLQCMALVDRSQQEQQQRDRAETDQIIRSMGRQPVALPPPPPQPVQTTCWKNGVIIQCTSQ